MKRLFSLMLACSLIVSCAFSAVTARADEADPTGQVQTADEAQTAPAKDFDYTVNHAVDSAGNNIDTVTITGYKGNADTVVIPDEINGMAVTGIGDRAFNGSDLSGVVLPETLTAIGEGAFVNNYNLKEVTIPKSVKTIKDGAFGCFSHNYIDHEVSPDEFMEYRYDDFTMYGYVGTAADEYSLRHAKIHFVPLDCRDASAEYFDYTENEDGGITITKFHEDNLPDVIAIPETIDGKPVTKIADYASSNRSNEGKVVFEKDNDKKTYEDFGFSPKTVVLSENIEYVGEFAFGYVYAKTVYAPPDIVNSIYWQAFKHSITVQIDTGDTDGMLEQYFYVYYDSVTFRYTGVFETDSGITDDGFEFSIKDGGAEIGGYTGDDKDVYIRKYIDGYPVTAIGDYAFYGSDISGISLPGSLRKIGYYAFYDCCSLQNVTFRTGEYVKCGLDVIEKSAFEGCSLLTSITIPADVEEMEDCGLGVFRTYHRYDGEDWNEPVDYEKETDDIPEDEKYTIVYESVRHDYGNHYHTEDKKKLCFPFTLYGIRGTAAQDYAEQYDTVTFVPIDEDNIAQGYRDLEYMVDDRGDVLITGAKESADEIKIPEYIPSGQLHYDDREVTAVAENAFKDNKNIKSVSFDRWIFFSGRTVGVTEIGSYAFAGCDDLDTVDFTSGIFNPIIEKIGECAFVDCGSLGSVTIPMSVTNIGDHAFGYVTDGDGFSLVPDFVICGYTGSAAEEYANNNGIKFEPIGYRGFEYTVIGGGEASGQTGFAEITAYRGNDLTVDVPETLDNAPVRVIGESAFADNNIVKTVNLPESVMYIKDNAFRGCEQLKRIQSYNIVHVGDYAFAECSNISELLLAGDVKYIGERAIGWSCYTLGFDYGSREVMEAEDWYDVRLKNGRNIYYESGELATWFIDYNYVMESYAKKYTNITFEVDEWKINSMIVPEFSDDLYVYNENNNERYTVIDDVVLIRDESEDNGFREIPVTKIAAGEFRNKPHDEIEAVIIGNNIEKIEADTFTNCSTIKEFYIPASVEKIEDYAIGYNIYPMEATPDSPAHIHHKVDGIVIFGYENTEAQRYANDNDIKFYSLGGANIDYCIRQTDSSDKTNNNDVPNMKGDANGDGKVSAKDSLLIQRYALKLAELDAKGYEAADVNGDGKVTAKDALEVLRFTIGAKSVLTA